MTRSILRSLFARNRRSRRAARPHGEPFCLLESLESRTLMSVTFDTLSQPGTLIVTGNGANDHIALFAGESNGQVIGKAKGQSAQLFENIDAIIVYGGGGNDKINVNALFTDTAGNPIGVFIDGGAGNDNITGSQGNDTILGGTGNDRVRAIAGNNIVYGGAGNDVLAGGTGSDSVFGGGGNDKATGGTGNDLLDGGPGLNKIDGGEGTDGYVPRLGDKFKRVETAEDAFVPTVVSTEPADQDSDVPPGQVLSATFNTQFMDGDTITTSTFLLTGPGDASITGTVSYSNGVATFTPDNPLDPGDYTATLTTGVLDLAGNPLAANFQWTFTVDLVPADVPPSVTETDPQDGQTNVPPGQIITATFSEEMNPLTINSDTFVVTGPGDVQIAGLITYMTGVASFTPNAALSDGVYTAKITTGAQDLTGNGLGEDYIWSFTVDAIAPTVTETDPADGEAGIPTNKVITATFSEAMDADTINDSTFLLVGPGDVAVSGTVTYLDGIATFTPDAPLSGGVYTATITTGAQDLAGNGLAADYSWSFTVDDEAPTVVATNPANGALMVPLDAVITATFSEAMDPSTINTLTFTLLQVVGSVAVQGTVTYADGVATFTPTGLLLPLTLYQATITVGATDLAGNPLAENYSWTFTTELLPIIPII